MNIRQHLEQQATMTRSIGGGLMETFVLRNGTRRRGATYKGPRGSQKECFQNAADMVAMRNVGRYVEGYAVRPSLGLLIHHAWVEIAGRVHDMTWDRPEECEYIGVSFSPAQLRRELSINQYYGLFVPYITFNTRLMLERDPGLVEVFPQLAKKEDAV